MSTGPLADPVVKRALAWSAFVAVLVGTATSAAQPKTPSALPQRTAVIGIDAGRVLLSVAYHDAVDAEIAGKLENGLPTVITMRGYVFRDGTTEPIALTAKSCRVVYDLWEEVFRIQITQPGGTSSAVALSTDGVLRHCAEARRLPLVERALLDPGYTYFVAALVEVNPVSQETLDRIKKWVTRPGGSAAIGPGDALFGSFVGLFVARIGDAERKVYFRTQAFAPP